MTKGSATALSPLTPKFPIAQFFPVTVNEACIVSSRQQASFFNVSLPSTKQSEIEKPAGPLEDISPAQSTANLEGDRTR